MSATIMHVWRTTVYAPALDDVPLGPVTATATPEKLRDMDAPNMLVWAVLLGKNVQFPLYTRGSLSASYVTSTGSSPVCP